MKKLLKKSPINYFSDLFIAAMVVVWIAVIILMSIFKEEPFEMDAGEEDACG